MSKKIALAVSLVALFAISGTAIAGNNGGGPNKSSSSSIALVSSSVAAATSSPTYGSFVSFSVSTTDTQYPYVNLVCYQNGALVAEGWAAYFGGTLNTSFGLYSPQWTGGAAQCTAYLDSNSNGKWKQLASTSFNVGA